MDIIDNKSVDNTNNKEKRLSTKRWLLVSLGVSLGVVILFFSVYLVLNIKGLHYETNRGNTNLTTTPTQEEKIQTTKKYKLEEIFTPEEKISSSQIAPNNTYAFVVTQKSTPVKNIFKENENGPVILVMDNLIFVNLSTKEKREFDLYDLASKEIIDPLKTIPAQVQYTLRINLLKWSADSNDFWGAINLVPGADPPVNDSVSLFKINTKDWTIERFALPGNYISSLEQQNLNLDKNAVLFESATPKNELYLFNYDIPAKKKVVVVSYPNSIFSKYLPGKYGFLEYFYPSLWGAESRRLEAKWLDEETVSYTDFVTRQEVVKRIE
jgi:hypothetical protein